MPRVARYSIWFADLNPVRGSEIARTRPVVVVSLDAMNQNLDTIVVCPLTSKLHPRWRSRLTCTILGKRAEIAVDQIRAISKERLGKNAGILDGREAAQLRRLITEMYGE